MGRPPGPGGGSDGGAANTALALDTLVAGIARGHMLGLVEAGASKAELRAVAHASVCAVMRPGGPILWDEAGSSLSDQVADEVVARLQAIAPGIAMQAHVMLEQGVGPRTAAGLTSADVHVLEGAAKHNFEKPIEEISVREARAQRRGRRRHVPATLGSPSLLLAGSGGTAVGAADAASVVCDASTGSVAASSTGECCTASLAASVPEPAFDALRGLNTPVVSARAAVVSLDRIAGNSALAAEVLTGHRTEGTEPAALEPLVHETVCPVLPPRVPQGQQAAKSSVAAVAPLTCPPHCQLGRCDSGESTARRSRWRSP